uniref:GLOBIN domain-containing protein n=1 Tax=Panagrellus redivivus TaxID=6233 RepID=A0A7E4V911_PANRE
MGNKNSSQARQTLQHQASVPATPSPANPQQRINRRSSEFRFKTPEATDRPSTNNSSTSSSGGGGDASAKLNSQFIESYANVFSGDKLFMEGGRRWSTAAVGTARNNTMKPKRLAPRQRNLIIKSWNKTAKAKVGKDIFVSIFNEAEELRSVFGIAPGLKGKKLRADPMFTAHTDLFIDTFDFVIRNLDDISMVVENAEQLGRRHASFHIENFRPEYWSIFTECIVETVADTDDKETQIAWRQLVLTLIFYMKLGYERECLRITRNAQNAHHTHHGHNHNHNSHGQTHSAPSRTTTPSSLLPNPDIPVL